MRAHCLALATGLASGAVGVATLRERVDDSIGGLFAAWWQGTSPLQPGFLFACGQIGAAGVAPPDPNTPPYPAVWDQCVCESPARCTNCYRWWQAIALESIANRGIYFNDDTSLPAGVPDVAGTLLGHASYNGNWTGDCPYIDDFGWFFLAYIRYFEWTKDVVYLDVAKGLHAYMTRHGVDEGCGGVLWNPGCQGVKNSVTLLELLIGSAKLAVLVPEDPAYLDRAKSLWAWFESSDLFDEHGLVTDGVGGDLGEMTECCNVTHELEGKPRCVNNMLPGYSYNQGLYLSAAAHLYRATEDTTYLRRTGRLVDAVLQNSTDASGLLKDVPNGQPSYLYPPCVEGQDPGGDWYSFKGAFMMHLGYFMTIAGRSALSASQFEQVVSFVRRNAEAVWANASVVGAASDDVCSTAQSAALGRVRKFHWEWDWGVTPAPAPPPADPSSFFTKTGLRSYGGDGIPGTLSAGGCQERCAANASCHSYTYADSQTTGFNEDCWLCPFERAGPGSCDFEADLDFVTGIRRPSPLVLGGGVCAADDCGKPVAKDLGNNQTCFCDEECTKRFDCCLNFAAVCSAAPTSCKADTCHTVDASAIPGGGYCFCDDTCLTDMHNCCPDFHSVCDAGPEPARLLCMDARAHGSAVNLLVTDAMLSELPQQREEPQRTLVA